MTKKKDPSDNFIPAMPFPVVGIGASAGGLEAATLFFKHLPIDTGMSFVFVQHLDPKAHSSLTEILARTTKVPVTIISDGVALQPNHIYVMSPNTSVKLSKNIFEVVPRSDTPKSIHLPIDYFLNSLAEAQKHLAIGVILTGLGSDGAAGVKAINVEGGITFAQDEQSAAYPSMPNMAVSTGCVDISLTPEKIAEEIGKLSKHPLVKSHSIKEFLPDQLSLIEKILFPIRKQFGVNFSQYKQSTVKRRIHRRMVIQKLTSLEAYLDLVTADPSEVENLYDDLLIKVTSFFRDPETFEVLKNEVFPKIMENRSVGQPLRVWIPACSSGEEAYSMAIALLEFLGTEAASTEIQIFATDLSEKAILKAREGIYPDSIAASISPERLRRFFIKVDHGFQISKSIRGSCVFAVHNILSDPPFSKVDLVTCRNLLIYFNSALQEKVIPLIHYALNPTGFLVLGSAESIGKFSDLFECVDNKQKVYAKKINQKTRYFEPPAGFNRNIIRKDQEEKALHIHSEKETITRVNQFLMNRFVPSGFVVDKDMEIVQIRGDTSPFVQFTQGVPSYNLQKILRQELRAIVRSSLHKAIKTEKAQVKEGTQLRNNGLLRHFQVQVLPINILQSDQKYYAILFTETPRVEQASLGCKKTDTSAKSRESEINIENKHLEHELSDTKEQLQEIIEEQEATNEELKSSNEEILSGNEELQSTNEELQTSKEEVQSANEELSTLNEELQNRNIEIEKVNDDLSNVLLSSRIPIILLGPDLCVRHYTPPATKLLRLIPTDLGRPIRDIKLSFELSNLEELVEEVIDNMHSKKQEIRDKEGNWYSLQIHPFKTSENKIVGALIAFVDIHEIKLGYEKDKLLATIVRDSQDAITVQDLTGKITAWNKGAQDLYGYSEQEALKMNSMKLVPSDKSEEALNILDKLSKGISIPPLEVERINKDGHRFEVGLSITAIFDQSGNPVLVTTTERDITKLKHSEEKFKALLDSAATAMVVLNDKAEIVLVNTLTEELFGYKRDELLGEKVEILIPERFRKKHIGLRNTYLKAPKFRKLNFDHEFFGRSKQGHEFPVDICLSPIKTADGLLISSSIIDITAQKKEEDNLKLAKFHADSASNAKTNFLANMSHEIRTPLAAIIGFSELMNSSAYSDQQRNNFAKRIWSSGKHLNQLIDDILDLTKIEAGMTEINITHFPFIEELSEIFANLQSQAEAKDIEFKTKFEGSLPLFIESDDTRLRQILINIVGNAIKFTSEGSVEVTVRLDQESSKDEQPAIEFIVKDTGCGILPKNQKKIFDPFVQADSSTTRNFGGTGLGLVLSRKLANALGGDVILLKEASEKGSTFVIKITPKAMFELNKLSEDGQGEPGNQDGHIFEKEKLKFSGLRVLVAEDSIELQALLGEVLNIFGAEVVFVEDGQEAVRKAQTGNFDLIFMDIQMPVMDGYQATRKLRKDGLKIPIIALTARVLKEEQQKCLDVGCNDCLVKPYDFNKIVSVMEKNIKKS